MNVLIKKTLLSNDFVVRMIRLVERDKHFIEDGVSVYPNLWCHSIFISNYSELNKRLLNLNTFQRKGSCFESLNISRLITGYFSITRLSELRGRIKILLI